MAIGPQGPLLKNDGPACRVCGCTEHNACVLLGPPIKRPRSWQSGLVTCSWVKVEGATEPLCSACSGTVSDLAEAMARGRRLVKQHGEAGFAFMLKINDAALARYRTRERAEGRK